MILGAGNEIKNSITSISVSGSASTDVATASQAIRDSMANGYAGGATLIIGGGNKTDYTQSSQIIGVGSSITGTKENPAQFNMLNGVQSISIILLVFMRLATKIPLEIQTNPLWLVITTSWMVAIITSS